MRTNIEYENKQKFMKAFGHLVWITFSKRFWVSVITLIVGSAPATAAPPTPKQITNYLYLVGTTTGAPGIMAKIAQSDANLIILGSDAAQTPLDRRVADPTNSKLIFRIVNTTEASPNGYPDLFTSSTLPSWFGNTNPEFPNNHSVQYWNPLWEVEVFKYIDIVAGQGYDGVFLDVLTGDTWWLPGNRVGNTVNPDATAALATLLTHIRQHVDALKLGRPFYLMGNGPENIALKYPDMLKNLDIIFNENLYFSQKVSGGVVINYALPASNAAYLLANYAPIFNAQNLTILGNDYPDFSDPTTSFKSFDFYSALGWIPSVEPWGTTAQTLATGPFMYMATALSPAVAGRKGFLNFLSGGLAPKATLTGGDQGDYFVGGSGQNIIIGGVGNDKIYAHPSTVLVKNLLEIALNADVKNVASPTLTIRLNGKIAQSSIPITATTSQSQIIQVDTTAFEPVSTIELVGNVAAFIDSTHYANIQPKSIKYQATSLSFGAAQYNSGSQALSGGTSAILNPNGIIKFSTPTLPIAAPIFGNTSDTIDGGGGVNTVVYRGPMSRYSIVPQGDGSIIVSSATTSEGPDTIRNVQYLQFSDQTIPAIFPQTGWWWNPNDVAGRGYSIEVNNGRIFLAAYMYRDDGSPVWYIADEVYNAPNFSGTLFDVNGSQTLNSTGAGTTSAGPTSLKISGSFTTATQGSLILTGGPLGSASKTIPITRFPFDSTSVKAPSSLSAPQAGWWYNSDELGVGYFIEQQANQIFMANYLYDSDQRDRWYIALNSILPSGTTSETMTGSLLQVTGGQTLTSGPLAAVSSTVGQVTLQFTSPTQGTVTLPNGRVVPITRFSAF